MGISLPLPPFDGAGNLDVGALLHGKAVSPIHYTTLADIRESLVTRLPDNARRVDLWSGWMNHRRAIEALGIQYSTLVDGSFASNKRRPNDVDLCYILDAQEINALGAPEKARLSELLDTASCKTTYLCDPYHIRWYPMTHMRFQETIRDMAYWTRQFGTDRKGRPKAILMVGERGTI